MKIQAPKEVRKAKIVNRESGDHGACGTSGGTSEFPPWAHGASRTMEFESAS